MNPALQPGRREAATGEKEVQSPETAVKPDMPESAIESGYIDFVLSPKDIAQELVRIAHAPP